MTCDHGQDHDDDDGVDQSTCGLGDPPTSDQEIELTYVDGDDQPDGLRRKPESKLAILVQKKPFSQIAAWVNCDSREM